MTTKKNPHDNKIIEKRKLRAQCFVQMNIILLLHYFFPFQNSLTNNSRLEGVDIGLYKLYKIKVLIRNCRMLLDTEKKNLYM